MKKSTSLGLVFLYLFVGNLAAQDRIKPYNDYIRKYTPLAISQQVVYGIPASITLAQGLLESNAGNSTLAKNSNNHFGIKCHSDWTGLSYSHFDDGEMSCFRKYPNVDDSFKDHSLFLVNRPRYASLFELNVKNYKAWAKGLKKAGYATDRHYDKKLIAIIEQYELNKIDKIALNKRKAKQVIRNWEKNHPDEMALAAKQESKEASSKTKTTKTQAPKEKPAKNQTKIKKTRTQAMQKTSLAEKAKDYNYIAEISRQQQIERNERNERTDNLPHVINAIQNHTIFYKGLCPYIIAQYGDNFDNISDEFGLGIQGIKRWNEFPPNYKITVGDIIFLGKKALSWEGENDTYIVRDGDSMHSISQQFGLRLSALYQLNNMALSDRIYVGLKLKLRAQE